MTKINSGRAGRRETGGTDAPSEGVPDVVGSATGYSTKPDGPSAKGQRIAKVMARAGLCSRREAETWIAAGRVTVNGDVLASAARDIDASDDVLVDGEPLPMPEKTRLFLFHKPRGLVTSDRDPEGRETVADFLRENWPDGPRIVTIGRLDINTEGLLLLTNDGGLARQLELPETGWLRRYRVRAKGTTDQARLDELAAGITIEGVSYNGIEAKLDRVQGSNCWLTMGLREGKNREIKRVLEHIGLEVNRLIRLSFGPFQLLDLPEGVVEEVRTRVLRDQLGATLAAAAGVLFDDPADNETSPVRVDPPPGRRSMAPRSDRRADATDRTDTAAFAGAAEDGRGRQARDASVPRRHVSSLRQAKSSSDGPRRRTERSATKDRNDRPIAVERVMTAAPSRFGVRSKSDSPSAEGKRARIARSAPRDDAFRREGRRGRDRDAAPNEGGRRERLRPNREGRGERERDGSGARAFAKPRASTGQRTERRFDRDDAAASRPMRSQTTRGSGEGRRERDLDHRTGASGRPTRSAERSGERPNRTSERPARSGDRPSRSGERVGRGGSAPNSTGDRPLRAFERAGDRSTRSGERSPRSNERPSRSPERSGERPARTGDRPGRSRDDRRFSGSAGKRSFAGPQGADRPPRDRPTRSAGPGRPPRRTGPRGPSKPKR